VVGGVNEEIQVASLVLCGDKDLNPKSIARARHKNRQD
jgi:hypothetical protein